MAIKKNVGPILEIHNDCRRRRRNNCVLNIRGTISEQHALRVKPQGIKVYEFLSADVHTGERLYINNTFQLELAYY